MSDLVQRVRDVLPSVRADLEDLVRIQSVWADPQRRDEVVALGLKSIVSGTLATCLMGAIVGVLT